jgi:hypothetical protein
MAKTKEARPRGKPISLYPLEPKEALRKFLQVPPPTKEKKTKSPAVKRG